METPTFAATSSVNRVSHLNSSSSTEKASENTLMNNLEFAEDVMHIYKFFKLGIHTLFLALSIMQRAWMDFNGTSQSFDRL